VNARVRWVTIVVSQLIALMANLPSQHQEAILSVATRRGKRVRKASASPWPQSVAQSFCRLFPSSRQAKVNLLERVRYGAPTADIESAIEEFEEAWSATEGLVKQLIAPSKP
jgi:hypothetical protein